MPTFLPRRTPFGLSGALFIKIVALASAVLLGFWFIYRSMITGLDGTPVFTLFDDGMISLTYALNFMQGHGLVWCPNEWVEGYTNPLWVMVMAGCIGLLGPTYAALGVQLLGLLCFVGCVAMALYMANRYTNLPKKPLPSGAKLSALALAAGLVMAHYPLLFWALSGMEVGPLAVVLMALNILVAHSWNRQLNAPMVLAFALLGVIAYGLRPDGALLAAFPLALRSFHALRQRAWADVLLLGMVAACVVAVMAAHLFWRHATYGVWVPNTYVLKMAHFSIEHRLSNGLSFIGQYLWRWGPLLAILGYFAWRGGLLGKLAVGGLALACVYQVWVGGDPWLMWRQLTPNATLVLAAGAAPFALWWWMRRSTRTGYFMLVGAMIAVAWGNLPTASQLLLPGRFPFGYEANQQNYRTVQVLKQILPPNATVAVFWGGLIPYYWPGPAYDMLGKTNTEIATLAPDREQPAWAGMRGVVGHNKYQLAKSIETVKPAYIQYLKWGREDLTPLLNATYISVTVQGLPLNLRRKSSD